MKSFAAKDAVQHRGARKSMVPSAAGGGGPAKRKRREKSFGYFYTIPYTEQVALIEMARVQRQAERAIDHKDAEELDAYRAARRKSNSELELESLVKQFALAMSFFGRYKQRGVKTATEMAEELTKLSSNQAKLDWLREQIEMRVVGLCWVEFRSHWSSSADEFVGSVQDLTCQLQDTLEAEQERNIPAHAPAPIMQRKTFKELGTLTTQATQLANQRLSLNAEVSIAVSQHIN